MHDVPRDAASAYDSGDDRPVPSDDRPDLVERLSAPRPEPARHGTPPDGATVARLLRIATTVPDHGGLRPWRFAVVVGAGRRRLGEALAEGLLEQRGPTVPEAALAKARDKSVAAPCSVVLIASPRPGANVPEWEQVASAACTGYALVLAATAAGLGAVWKSASMLDTTALRALFRLEEHERLLGWVNLGSPGEVGRKSNTEPVELSSLVTVVGADDRPFTPEAVDAFGADAVLPSYRPDV